MAADYDRLFQPSEGADAPDEAGAGACGDYDVDSPPAAPPSPTNAPKPNGQILPPIPVDRSAKPAPARPLPPMPVDWTAQPPPIAPASPTQGADHPTRGARHARKGQSDLPNQQPGRRAGSQHSHRANPQHGNGKVTRPSVPLRAPAPAPNGEALETNGFRREPSPPPPAAAPRATVATAEQPHMPAVAGRVPQRGWRRRVHTLTRINLGPSRDEKYDFELHNRIRRPIHGSYEIGVLGLKGGAGKTSVTAALGSVFAHVRGDRILVVDADPVSGNLADRVGRQTGATIADLVANRAMLHYNDIRAHTSMNAVSLEVLSAADYNRTGHALSEEDWKRAVAMVPRYYNLVLADCGADLFGPAARGVLAAASGLVIMSSASADGARQAAVAIDWLRTNGHLDLLDRACVAINHVAPAASERIANDMALEFQQHVRPGRVVTLPWDQHVGAGTELQFALLGTAYRRRITELAAALSDDFDRGERR